MQSLLLERARKLIRSSHLTQTAIGDALGITPQRMHDLLVMEPSTQMQRLEAILKLLDGKALSVYTGADINTKQSDQFCRTRNVLQQLSTEMEEYDA